MRKRELTFLIAGALILLIVIFYSVFAIWFLVGRLNLALSKKENSQSGALHFQLERAETLKIR